MNKLFRNRFRYPLVAGALATGLTGGGWAYAHMGNDSEFGPAFGRGCGFGHHGGWRRHFSRAGERIEGKLAFVQAELKIAPEQEEAWAQFSDTMRSLARERAQFIATMRESIPGKSAEIPLVERLDNRVMMMEQGFAHFKKMAEAVKTLYAELTPEQRKIADGMWPFRRG